jgi:two-component system response regulator YesN
MCQIVTALVVDDENSTRQILTKHIPWEKLGVTRVYSAANGIEGLEIAREWKPDIIISDIKMPFMNGIDMAKHIRDELPECRFAFLSAYTDKEYLKTAIKLKATSFIEKPIDIEEVSNLVLELVSECKNDSSVVPIKFTDQEVIMKLNKEKEVFLELLQQTKAEFTSTKKYCIAAFKLHVLLVSAEYASYLEEFEMVFPKKTSLKGIDAEDVFYFIVKQTEEECTFITKLQEVISGILKRNARASIFATAYKTSVDLSEIQGACHNAAAALSGCYFHGENQIYIESPVKKNYEVEGNLIPTFERYLKERKKQEVMLLLHKLSSEFEKNDGTAIIYVKNIYYKLTFVIIHLVENQKLAGKFNRGEIMQNIAEAETLKQTASEVKQTALKYLELASLEELESEEPLRKIEQYLHQNYHNVDININELARYFNFTPSYLCAMYKKLTGSTINQSITTLRIDKAKELLQSPELKLYDIANEVGYLDGKYFTKVFTKNTGISPKQYRERYLQYDSKGHVI